MHIRLGRRVRSRTHTETCTMRVERPPYNIVGRLQRHDQKNTMWVKGLFEQEHQPPRRGDIRREKMAKDIEQQRRGYGLEEYAFSHATWYLARGLQDLVDNAGGELHYSWNSQKSLEMRRLEAHDPAEMSEKIKQVAAFIGADLVGICKLDRDWVYSHSFDYTTGAHKEIVFEDLDEPLVTEERRVIPNKVNYAIVLATAMEIANINTSPSLIEHASTGMGYSRMVMLAGTLAEFVRGLGFLGIPCGNDTALSIPLAIDGGLGQLGRNGLLITPQFGSRIRLCKVLTDLPLEPDKPIDFGVTEFCSVCKKCAKSCPSQAISHGEMTSEGQVEENSSGVSKWYVNPQKCYLVQMNQGSCSNCIRSCPFNKPRRWYHNLTRGFIDSVRPANRLWARLDDTLGYGKRMPPENWWKHTKE